MKNSFSILDNIVSPSKYPPLESNSLFFLFHALLEEFFRDAPQLRYYGSFDELHAFKTEPSDDPLWLREKEKVKQGESRWMERLLKSQHIYLVPLLFRHSKTFGDDLPKIVLFHIQQTCNHWTVNWRSPLTTCSNRLMLPSVLLVEDLPPPCGPLWRSCARNGVTSSHYWSVSCAWDGVFWNRTKNFRFIRSSVLIAELPEKKGINKSMWKNTMISES